MQYVYMYIHMGRSRDCRPHLVIDYITAPNISGTRILGTTHIC